MTSSETPTDEPARRAPAPPWDRDRWIRFGVIVGAILVGWVFIASTHKFRLGPAVVFLALGWVAVVAGVHNLWRTGTSTTDPVDEEAAWWRPTGAREELEREKRALLKAIKEVEFDLQLGKMSTKDADEITRVYRARAIEVIKALDELEASGDNTVRQQIERELRARVAIDSQAKKGEAAAKEHKERRDKKARAVRPGAARPEAGKPAEAAAAAEAEPDPDPDAETSQVAEPDAVAPAVAPPAPDDSTKPAADAASASEAS